MSYDYCKKHVKPILTRLCVARRQGDKDTEALELDLEEEEEQGHFHARDNGKKKKKTLKNKLQPLISWVVNKKYILSIIFPFFFFFKWCHTKPNPTSPLLTWVIT